MAYPELKCVNEQGNEISLAELEQWFGGKLDIRRATPFPGAPIVRVVGLRAKDSGAVQFARLLKQDGAPYPKAGFARWWDRAPGLDPFPPDCLATRWKDNADVAITKENGYADWGMGQGDKPPGSSGVFPLHCPAPADAVFGLGWSPGKEHKVVVPTFQEFAEDPGPGPDPEPGDGLAEAVNKLAAAVNRLADCL